MQRKKVDEILTFLRRSKGLESAKRYRTSLKGEQNTVAEHSWRLALMAFVIGTECRLNLDMGHALSLATLHDLAEAQTGDIDAYEQIQGGNALIAEKAAQEEAAMRDMTKDLSLGTKVMVLWREYEEQTTIEAKFVKALDKIEGFLHIAEGEVAMYIPKEFHGDYANRAVAAFDEATEHFPGLKDLLDAVKADLRKQFTAAGVEWVEVITQKNA